MQTTNQDSDIVVIDAVRTPIGRRGGDLAGFHSADLLATTMQAVVDRSGIDPAAVDQAIGGCISQVGQQAFNVTRTAWLTAGLPENTAATTVDSQCGSSQQAITLAHGLLAGGLADAVVACGVEVMSRVPLGSGMSSGVGKGIPKSYFSQYEFTTQFEAAERIADKWGITRDDTDRLGVDSQERAARAWEEGRFDTQVIEVDAPLVDDDGKPTGETQRVTKDGALRPTSMEGLSTLKPVARPDGVHTAGTSSQIADAASSVLLTTRARAAQLGLKPRARIVDSCLVAGDPVLMLTQPIDATRRLFENNGVAAGDVDVYEINEAFASVVLAWEREIEPDHDRVNPNGGAIAMGHALGSTGCLLVTKAVHELERTDGELGLVSMCCGGGLGTGTLLVRE